MCEFLTPGQNRSGHQVTLTDLDSKKVCNRAQPAVFVTEVSNLVDCMTAWVPLTCFISDFFYISDLSSGQHRYLSIMSMEKNGNASRSMCTHRNSPHSKSGWFGTAVMVRVRFLTNILLKGHQRSLEATNSFFVNNYWLKTDRTLGMASLCLSHQDASTDM